MRQFFCETLCLISSHYVKGIPELKDYNMYKISYIETSSSNDILSDVTNVNVVIISRDGRTPDHNIVLALISTKPLPSVLAMKWKELNKLTSSLKCFIKQLQKERRWTSLLYLQVELITHYIHYFHHLCLLSGSHTTHREISEFSQQIRFVKKNYINFKIISTVCINETSFNETSFISAHKNVQ